MCLEAADKKVPLTTLIQQCTDWLQVKVNQQWRCVNAQNYQGAQVFEHITSTEMQLQWPGAEIVMLWAAVPCSRESSSTR